MKIFSVSLTDCDLDTWTTLDYEGDMYCTVIYRGITCVSVHVVYSNVNKQQHVLPEVVKTLFYDCDFLA